MHVRYRKFPVRRSGYVNKIFLVKNQCPFSESHLFLLIPLVYIKFRKHYLSFFSK